LSNNLLILFNEARENKKPVLLKRFMPDVPSWENFIKNLHNKANSEQLMKYGHGRHLKDIAVYNYLDPFVAFAASMNDENGLKGLDSTIKLLSNFLGAEFFNVKSIINFAGHEADYYKHEDPNDVISWHCIGTVEWRIYNGDEYESYHLNPGDIFYCPKGTVHQIVVSEPRASIVLDYFNPLDN
jgi:uncharacterized RmlC-like cupin family protein